MARMSAFFGGSREMANLFWMATVPEHKTKAQKGLQKGPAQRLPQMKKGSRHPTRRPGLHNEKGATEVTERGQKNSKQCIKNSKQCTKAKNAGRVE